MDGVDHVGFDVSHGAQMSAAFPVDRNHQRLQIRFAIGFRFLGEFVELGDSADVAKAQSAGALVLRGLLVLGLGLEVLLLKLSDQDLLFLVPDLERLGNDVFATGIFGRAKACLGEVIAMDVKSVIQAVDAVHRLPGRHGPVLNSVHYLLKTLTIGEVSFPGLLRGFIPVGKCRGHYDGEEQSAEQAQDRRNGRHV